MPKLADVTRRRVVWFAILVTLAAYASAVLLVPRQTLMQFLNLCGLSLAVAIVVTYTPAWIAPFRKRRPMDDADYLSIGIFGWWLVEIGTRIVAIFRIGLNRPDLMADSYLMPLLLTVAIVSGAQFITAPGAMDGTIPRRNWIILGASLGTATLIALLLIWFGLAVPAAPS